MDRDVCGQQVGPGYHGTHWCDRLASFRVTADDHRGGSSVDVCGQHLARAVRDTQRGQRGVVVRELED